MTARRNTAAPGARHQVEQPGHQLPGRQRGGDNDPGPLGQHQRWMRPPLPVPPVARSGVNSIMGTAMTCPENQDAEDHPALGGVHLGPFLEEFQHHGREPSDTNQPMNTAVPHGCPRPTLSGDRGGGQPHLERRRPGHSGGMASNWASKTRPRW